MTATDTLRPSLARPAAGPARLLLRAGSTSLARTRLPWPVFVYLLAVVLPISFQAGPLALTTLRVFLILMVIPLGVQLLMGRFGRVFLTDYLFVAHIAWATVALAANNPDQVIQQVGSVGVEFLGGYLVGRAYIRTPEDFAALCRVLVLIVCCSLPFALFETQTGRPIIIEYLHRLPGLSSVGIVTIEGRMGLERVQAMFAHPIHYGLFCSVAFSLAFVGLKDVTGTGRRWVTSILIAGCGFLALSSGALLAIALQLGLITWSAMFAKVQARWWLLVGLFALMYVVIDILSNRTPLRVFMSYATFSAHNAYWRGIIFEWGMKNVWANPLFGIGLNDWVRPHYMYSGSMDNFWLVMAVRYGIPGFLTLAIGYAVAVLCVMRRDFAGDAVLTHFRRAWVFTFLGLSFTLCTVHVWTNIYSFVFFMFGAGMWFILAAPKPVGALPNAAPGAARGGAGPIGVPQVPAARVPAPRLRARGGAATPVGRATAVDPSSGPTADVHSRFPAIRRRGSPPLEGDR